MNQRLFASYVENTQKAFRRFLTALCCGDTQLADDIAQETYIKAYIKCDSLKDTERFNAWIYKIGYNTFLNHRRSTRTSIDCEEILTLTSEKTADDSFRYQALYDALKKLTDKERLSILLFYIENYSIKEIAVIEDVSADAVKQHLSRGRKHLREILTDKMQ